jgi:hypothetical protein
LFAVYWGHAYNSTTLEGQTIHVFDLKGNFVRAFQVDASFGYIAVTENGSEAYVMSFMTGQIFRLRFPKP